MTTTDLVHEAGEPSAIQKPRREFMLPDEDVEGIEAHGWHWETIVDNGCQWLFIENWKLPVGYNINEITIAVRIPSAYPSAALDMVYVSPRLQRKDGVVIAGLSNTTIGGRAFQQWSRHYSTGNPWRPDSDNVVTHLRAAQAWFLKALK